MDTSAKPWEALHDTGAVDIAAGVVEMLGRLGKRNLRTQHSTIHVRIGLHVGTTYVIHPESGDLHGNDVNIAFRLEGLTSDAFESSEAPFPEQDRILVTRTFREDLPPDQIPANTSFQSCGEAKLKGITAPTGIFLVNTPPASE